MKGKLRLASFRMKNYKMVNYVPKHEVALK
jgi:hypothetical protein